jgi:hypothetical protein
MLGLVGLGWVRLNSVNLCYVRLECERVKLAVNCLDMLSIGMPALQCIYDILCWLWNDRYHNLQCHFK